MLKEFGDSVETQKGDEGESPREHGLDIAGTTSDDLSKIEGGVLGVTDVLPLPVASDGCVLSRA